MIRPSPPAPASRRMLVIAIVGMMAVALCRPAWTDSTLGTAFTYQGKLTDASGKPLSGSYSLGFKLFDGLTAGNQVGNTVTLPGVKVTNGFLTVQLDFGSAAFAGSKRWLETILGTDTLSPRIELTPAPLAVYAQTAGSVIPKRCIRVDVIEQDDIYGGKSIMAHTHNGVVGIEAGVDAFTSSAAMETQTTVKGWRALTCGPDPSTSGFWQQWHCWGKDSYGNYGFLGPEHWTLPISYWWSRADGTQIAPAAITPDDTQITFNRVDLIGYAPDGVNGRCWDETCFKQDRAFLLKLVSMEGTNEQTIFDPSDGFDPSAPANQAKVLPLTSAVQSSSIGYDYAVPVRLNTPVSDKVRVKIWINNNMSTSDHNILLLKVYPSASLPKTWDGEWSREFPDSTIAQSQINLQNFTTPGWVYADVPGNVFVPGMNLIYLRDAYWTGTAVPQLAYTNKTASRRNLAIYFVTQGGYPAAATSRLAQCHSWTIYRDYDYIDVWDSVPPVTQDTADGCGGPSLPTLNLAWNGECDYRGVVPTQRQLRGRKLAWYPNKVILPNGTVCDYTAYPIADVWNGAPHIGDQFQFGYDPGNGVYQHVVSVEYRGGGTAGKSLKVLGFGRYPDPPYYSSIPADGLNDMILCVPQDTSMLAAGESDPIMRVHLERLVPEVP